MPDTLVEIDLKTFDNSIKDCIDKLSKLENNIEKDLLRLTYEAGNLVVEEAKKNHPFKNISSNLERSIHTSISKLVNDVIENQVGSWLDYAYFVEVGTKHAQAYPYLLPAFEKMFPDVVEYIVVGLRKILDAAGK